MHVHTNYSDSKATVEEVIETAKSKGLDGIAITDHHTMQGVEVAKRIQDGLLIIPGEEVETDRGDIISFGTRHLLPEGLAIEEAIERVHLRHGLVFVPHPTVPVFGILSESELRNLPIDGLEVFSAVSPLANYYALKNMRLAKKLGLLMIAGSDSHSAETVGDAYTIVEAQDRSVSSILEAIKLGRTKVYCRSSRLKFKIRMANHTITHLFREENRVKWLQRTILQLVGGERFIHEKGLSETS